MSNPIKPSQIGAVKLSAYTPWNYVEKTDRRGWVNYGLNNDYPDYLIDLYNESPTHHALCNSLAYWIFGAGMDSPQLEQYNFNDTLLRSCLEFKIHGYFFLEVVWLGNNIAKIEPMPSELIRCGERVGREIPDFWYSEDWSNTSKYKPRRMGMFKNDPEYIANNPNQILYIRPFSPGSFYYAKPDYIGAVEYAELEKRIGTFHNSAIKNGLAPSYIIKLKNGVPDIEGQRTVLRDLTDQLSGESQAGNAVVFFNDQGTESPEVEVVQLSDADKQYQFLSTESAEKIMIGHRVVSPMLFGLKTSTGLGSNADELVQAEAIMMRINIKPSRQMIQRGLKPLFDALGIDAVWKDGESAVVTKTVIETPKPLPLPAPTNLKLSKDISDEDIESIRSFLDDKGEVIADDDEEWELIDARPVDYQKNIDSVLKLASVPSSNPNGASEQDNELFKVRYGYAPEQTRSTSRSFCIKMVSAGKVYRKEDIEAAGDRAVNPGFGPGGSSTYDIWLYKGGARCHHFWERRIYMRRNNKKITVGEAQKMIREIDPDERDEFRLPVNNPKVARLPNDMPNNGFLNPQN
jgi:hypothetical protein